MAHPKLAAIRERYRFRCGYCGVTETDLGGELTVDHFVPLSVDGDNSDDNLVYCCPRCNWHKQKRPHLNIGIPPMIRVLHPLLDDTSVHFQEDVENGRLVPLTETGASHIAILRLNRPGLIEHRKELQFKKTISAQSQLLETANKELQDAIDAQNRLIRKLGRKRMP